MISKVIIESSGAEAIKALEVMLKALVQQDKDKDGLRVAMVFAPVLTADGNWMITFDIALDSENSIEFSAVQTGFGGSRFSKEA